MDWAQWQCSPHIANCKNFLEIIHSRTCFKVQYAVKAKYYCNETLLWLKLICRREVEWNGVHWALQLWSDFYFLFNYLFSPLSLLSLYCNLHFIPYISLYIVFYFRSLFISFFVCFYFFFITLRLFFIKAIVQQGHFLSYCEQLCMWLNLNLIWSTSQKAYALMHLKIRS